MHNCVLQLHTHGHYLQFHYPLPKHTLISYHFLGLPISHGDCLPKMFSCYMGCLILQKQAGACSSLQHLSGYFQHLKIIEFPSTVSKPLQDPSETPSPIVTRGSGSLFPEMQLGFYTSIDQRKLFCKIRHSYCVLFLTVVLTNPPVVDIISACPVPTSRIPVKVLIT